MAIKEVLGGGAQVAQGIAKMLTPGKMRMARGANKQKGSARNGSGGGRSARVEAGMNKKSAGGGAGG